MTGYVPFSVTRDEGPDGIVVRVAGEVDAATMQQLQDALGSDAGGPVTVDLTETTFMDSSALNALIRSARGGTVFTIRNPSPSVRKLFELTGLESYLSPES